jgi:hypothetical protein
MLEPARCFALFGAMWLGTSCSAHEEPRPARAVPASVSASAAAPAPLASATPSALRELEVPGFERALLFTPAGAASRPLLVAAHGAGGDPLWDCEYWRRLTGGRVFVLCLRGTPLGGRYAGYFYRDHHALGRELAAAEGAARAAEPRILAGSGVYAGFSQGASMAVPILHERAAAFPYAILIEGFTAWNIPLARRFVNAGGMRVLLACGSKQCAGVAKSSAHWLEVAGGQARFEMADGAGHTPAGPVMQHVEAALPWLVAGDANWP